jgi:3-(methylthio)propanoyl-CoA dehydrogenase
MFTMMNNARLNVGLQGVDIAERATQAALYYAKDRVQSSRAAAPHAAPVAIIEHPDVRRMVMRMRAQTQAIRSLLYYAAGQVDRTTLGVEGAKARADLLTPLAKSHGSDVGCEVASVGIQVHGGMGFVEETGAAQHYRDARIAPIYEGTNGIQAADLVGRKLTVDGGAEISRLIADIRAEATHPMLLKLVDACARTTQWMLATDIDNRLAGSAPFLTMLSVATCGWLLERQGKIAAHCASTRNGDADFLAQKQAVAKYYLANIAAEAIGLEAAATAGADLLYALTADQLAHSI